MTLALIALGSVLAALTGATYLCGPTPVPMPLLAPRLARVIRWAWSKLLRTSIAAVTVGPWMLLLTEDPSGALIRHEQEHVYQARRWTLPVFWLLYLVCLCFVGYRLNPYEKAARRAAGQEE